MVEEPASETVIVDHPAVVLGINVGVEGPEAIGARVEALLARVEGVTTSAVEVIEPLRPISIESVKSAPVRISKGHLC